ncbi:MAG TPA: WYL domain-containing protein [Burkholderiales bacterium]|nr:WYL domain-containing protein [Burkholderiales bacterium]
MDRTERFYKIDQLLSERELVPFQVFQEKLEVSRATVKRDLEYLRNRLHAPIVWDREAGGYRYGEPELGGAQFELPGLWFNASEIHALLTMDYLLANLQGGGVLAPHLEPLRARLGALLGTADNTADEIRRKVRILDMAARPVVLEQFAVVGSALLRRKRLRISYYARSRDEITEREVSPQRLVHYRDNWYLDAWCHLRNDLRSFAVDAIRRAEALDRRARHVPDKTLDAVLGAGYGIFAGRRVNWAKLRFTPERARWVSAETWHPKQKARFEEDGSYLLQVPYSDDRELVMDILRHGAGVEVLGPSALRARVQAELASAAARYQK